MYTVIGIHIIMHKCFRNTFFFSYLAVGISTQLLGKLVSPVEQKKQDSGAGGNHRLPSFWLGKTPLDETSVTRN